MCQRVVGDLVPIARGLLPSVQPLFDASRRHEERDLDTHLFQQCEPLVHLTRAGIVEAQTDGGALPRGPTKGDGYLAGARCQHPGRSKAERPTDPDHEESPTFHRVHLSSLVVAHYGSPGRRRYSPESPACDPNAHSLSSNTEARVRRPEPWPAHGPLRSGSRPSLRNATFSTITRTRAID